MAADDFAAFQAEIAVLKSAEDDDDQVFGLGFRVYVRVEGLGLRVERLGFRA
jgi:hypothetical protein